MVEGPIQNTDDINEGIFDRAGLTGEVVDAEVHTSLFDRNHFLREIKASHPEFLGPDVQVTFFD
jgi:hypothetical protein